MLIPETPAEAFSVDVNEENGHATDRDRGKGRSKGGIGGREWKEWKGTDDHPTSGNIREFPAAWVKRARKRVAILSGTPADACVSPLRALGEGNEIGLLHP